MTPEDWSDRTRIALKDAGLDEQVVAAVVNRALDEDFADGPDITTAATVPEGATATADITPRQAGILAGGPVAMAVFDSILGAGSFSFELRPDGTSLVPGTPAITVHGRTAGILTAERTALNILTHLTGIATVTRQWVDAVAGSGARIRDTRKTLPGLRALEKYAVRCGGGVNHRMSLGDAALIKDNHVAAAGSVRAAVDAVRSVRPEITLEVEVDTLTQLDEALHAGAQLILLDNFTIDETAEAVRRTRAGYPGVLLESSGGLTVGNAAAVAATGVDYLAVGSLTHSSPAVDLGLDLR
ncbi:nicotinate-nucleotide pyrophosphorylase [carboxylating] [Nakamurella panacisegetis]|uniref:Nicotinate-nucleotide pyrophosphorylase [carboxylating] n=1 Tax=Nakamurella panacisegetis TaxID=1090615 RepID=A0A1H0R4N8_9ACTN|nr:carboxylating nicotinate-nucleotide diphosphorylase [Nakamurella panacisegetis]SDP24375.1 nicotinate-nucleotide pyrophosphorylase [carboxylating] [Nakamurella panacisegetis]